MTIAIQADWRVKIGEDTNQSVNANMKNLPLSSFIYEYLYEDFHKCGYP